MISELSVRFIKCVWLIFLVHRVCSGFKDLFDWQHFIEELKDDIHIVETMPSELAGLEPFVKTPISWSKVRIALLSFGLLSWPSVHMYTTISMKTLGQLLISLVTGWLLQERGPSVVKTAYRNVLNSH